MNLFESDEEEEEKLQVDKRYAKDYEQRKRTEALQKGPCNVSLGIVLLLESF